MVLSLVVFFAFFGVGDFSVFKSAMARGTPTARAGRSAAMSAYSKGRAPAFRRLGEAQGRR